MNESVDNSGNRPQTFSDYDADQFLTALNEPNVNDSDQFLSKDWNDYLIDPSLDSYSTRNQRSEETLV